MRVILNDGSVTHVDEKYADRIVRNLSTSYTGITAELVIDELNRPADKRSIIGMFAYGMLEENKLIPES